MLHEEITSKGVKRTVVMLMADDLRQELGRFVTDYEVKVFDYGSHPCVLVTGNQYNMITSAAIESCQDVINCYKLRYDGIVDMVSMRETGNGDKKKYTPAIVIYFMY